MPNVQAHSSNTKRVKDRLVTVVPPTENANIDKNPRALVEQGETDKKEHYDLDGVSFEEKAGVIVASDASRLADEDALKITE